MSRGRVNVSTQFPKNKQSFKNRPATFRLGEPLKKREPREPEGSYMLKGIYTNVKSIDWSVKEKFFVSFRVMKGCHINVEVDFYFLLHVLLKIITPL